VSDCKQVEKHSEDKSLNIGYIDSDEFVLQVNFAETPFRKRWLNLHYANQNLKFLLPYRNDLNQSISTERVI